MTQSDLANRIGVEPPTLVGILDRMERDGWIERVACPEDRRCKKIRIAPKVDPYWDRMVEYALSVRALAADGLSPDEVKQLTGLLSRVHVNLMNAAASHKNPTAVVNTEV